MERPSTFQLLALWRLALALCRLGGSPTAFFRKHAIRLGALVLAIAGADAGDWPMFRGDAAQTGRAPATLAAAYTPLWSWKAGGGCSSVVVSGRFAVVGSADGSVHALDLATGAQRWSVALGDPIQAAPTIIDGDVVIGTMGGTLARLNLNDGAIRWKFTAEDKIVGAATWFGAAAERKLLVGSHDSNLYCLEAATGKLVWKYTTGNYVNGTPAIADLSGRQVAVVGGCDAVIHVVDLGSGKAVRTIPVSAYIAATVALDGGRVYVGHYGNEVVCADLATGAIVWTYQDRAFPFFAAPALTADAVVLGGRDRRIHCLERSTGKARWTFAVRGNADGPALVDATAALVGSDDGRLYLLDLATGRERWSTDLGAKIGSAPALVGELILVGCDDGSVQAFTADRTEPPKRQGAKETP